MIPMFFPSTIQKTGKIFWKISESLITRKWQECDDSDSREEEWLFFYVYTSPIVIKGLQREQKLRRSPHYVDPEEQ